MEKIRELSILLNSLLNLDSPKNMNGVQYRILKDFTTEHFLTPECCDLIINLLTHQGEGVLLNPFGSPGSGGAVFKYLKKLQYENVLTIERSRVDLRDSSKVEKYFKNKKIDYMIMAAARAGGILANSNYQDEFLILVLISKTA